MHKPFRRYITIVIVLAAAYLVPVTATNLAIDPSAQFRAVSIDAIDGYRLYGSRTAKAALIRQNAIDVAILGSSRPLAALDPEHEVFRGMRAYNLALPGTNIFEQWDLFCYLMEHTAPKHILLCIDFAFFDGARGGFDDFEKSLLNPKQSLSECWAESLFSVYALQKSWDVLSRYRSAQPQAYTPLGLRISESDAGWHDRFRLVLSQAARVAHLFPPPDAYAPERIAIVRDMVDLAQARGCEITILILPMHATMLELMFQFEQWPKVERWTRDLMASLNGAEVSVWDCTGFSARQRETIPPDTDAMTWFTDPSHCSRAYGDLILRTVMGRPRPADGRDDPVFVKLDQGTLDGHLADIAQARENYRAEVPDDMAFVEAIRNEVIVAWTAKP